MDHYSKARREGLRIYQQAIQANTDPYLPVLENKVPNLAQLSRLSLGVMTIPLDRVVGSVSQGRAFAFTENFLPILDGGSEFAAKWDRLYESVEAEGVNMPVTALEYMGFRTWCAKNGHSATNEASWLLWTPENPTDPTLADTDGDIRLAWKAALADLGLDCPTFDRDFIAGPPMKVNRPGYRVSS